MIKNTQKLLIAATNSQSTPSVKMTDIEKYDILTKRAQMERAANKTGNVANLFLLPYHIFAMSKAFKKNASDRFPTLNVISLLINPQNFKHKFTPITVSGLHIPPTMAYFNFVIITNNLILLYFFKAYFLWNNQAYPNCTFNFYLTLKEANKEIDFRKADLSNTIFISYLQSWALIAETFKEISLNLSGGKNGSRHMLSPLVFRFVDALRTMGFKHQDILFYFNSYESDLTTYGKNYNNAAVNAISNWNTEIDATFNTVIEPSNNLSTLDPSITPSLETKIEKSLPTAITEESVKQSSKGEVFPTKKS